MTTRINYTGKRCKTAYKRRLPSFMYLYYRITTFKNGQVTSLNQAVFEVKTGGF